MELTDAIRNRRAVRAYTDVPVQRAAIERITDAAALAPSAMNLQPWAFAVLLDRKRIDDYAGRIKSWLLGNPTPAELLNLIKAEDYNVFHRAPALVLILAKSSQRKRLRTVLWRRKT